MRVFMKKNITAYSGKDQEQDVVYRSLNNGNYCIAAEFTAPVNHPQHGVFSANSAVVRTLWNSVNDPYKAEMKIYAQKHSADLVYHNKLRVSAYCVFIKMIYAYAKAGALNVADLTYATISASVIKNIKGAVDAGHLEKVDGYEAMLTSM